ncbi:MAG: MFS transporter [Deltaproteobacteria bacterium]|nr:MFS transporter [Deltaproteobacteria bacterium]
MIKHPAIHWAWVILGICFVNLFVNYSVRLGYGVVLPEMIRTLDFGRADAGTIYNAYLFAYIAIAPLTGYLTDRLGGRRVISVCLLVLGIAVVLMGTVKTLWTASFFFGLAGLGATGLWAPVITLVQRWFALHRRGLALGVLSAGYGLGFATMGIVVPLIVESSSWHYAWFMLGAMALCMAIVSAVFLRSDPQNLGLTPWGQKEDISDQVASPAGVSPKMSLRQLFRNNRFWLIGLSYFAIAYSLYGITTFMVDYAKNQLGLPLEKASLLATIHGIGQVVGVLTVMPLSDYLGRKKTILISNTVIAAALAGILTLGNSWIMLCVCVGILAIFYGVTFPIYGACAGDYFPKESMGTVIGAWTPFYGTGAILTHWITGILRDSTGIYDHSFIISIIMALFGILLMSRVKSK